MDLLYLNSRMLFVSTILARGTWGQYNYIFPFLWCYEAFSLNHKYCISNTDIHFFEVEPILTTVDYLWRKFRWCNESKSGDFIHCVHAFFFPLNLLKKYNLSSSHIVCAFYSVYVHLSMCMLYYLSRGL